MAEKSGLPREGNGVDMDKEKADLGEGMEMD